MGTVITNFTASFDNSFNPSFSAGNKPAAPPQEGLIAISALNYQGAFRLDGDQYGPNGSADLLWWQEKVIIAINNTTGNLLVTGMGTDNTQNFGEFNIPALVKEMGGVLTNLNIGANTQPFIDVIDQAGTRTVDADESNGLSIYGLYELDGNVFVQYAVYYDSGAPVALDTTLVKQNSDNINLAINDVSHAMQLDGDSRCAGWISEVPPEWQLALGGTHIAGWSSGDSRGIIGRTSVGPSAYVFDIADMLPAASPVYGVKTATTPVLNYPQPNGMGISVPANFDSEILAAGNIWNIISTVDYGFIIPGTSTYMALGHDAGFVSGIGYKIRTNGYDPIDINDERNTYYLFNVNDLVSVKNGTKQPYEVVPYATGELNVPFEHSNGINKISGCTYDVSNEILYVSLTYADDSQGEASAQPLVVAYTLDGVA